MRNDALSVDECERLAPDAVVISPGPGYPAQAGITCEVIRRFAGKVPVLGVCLGHQGIFEVFGGRVVRCGEIVHGKVSSMQHDGKGVFAGVPQGFLATRYHSLVGDPATLPAVLEVTARCAPKSEPNAAPSIIQGVRHREFTVEGVQFHPESITTEHGKQLLRNFLALRGGKWSR
jgi:anthranilate synthase/aminodeoxychorismate synthase-like glutamine amidotransferase